MNIENGVKMKLNVNLENMSTDEMVESVMPTLLKAMKKKAFVDGYNASDKEALGLVLSKAMKWDSLNILDVTKEALEDSNFNFKNTSVEFEDKWGDLSIKRS